MPLEIGSRLGHYNVTAVIGEGGMGQVYQATDTKLNRQVALKILPEAFASDPDRLARFEREAQVLASLNHTNIGHIYGIEEAEGTKALVLELVEGPTLADRIAKGPIPLDEALPIAKQIAEALEAAHEASVIHRAAVVSRQQRVVLPRWGHDARGGDRHPADVQPRRATRVVRGLLRDGSHPGRHSQL